MQWPFPTAKSTLNISGRDVLISLAIVIVWIVSSWGKYAVLAACMYEPALLVFPTNVLQGLFLRTPRYWDALSLEPKLQVLLDNFQSIRKETLEVKNQVDFASVSIHQRRIAYGQPWKVFPLFVPGTINEDNCKQMPITSSLLLQIPSVQLAMLSTMEGGAKIPSHCGFLKGVLRVHLCIHTDEEDTEMQRYIEVGGEKYSWKQGEFVAFDDTYPHTVVNNVKGRRIVLFLDIVRPTGYDIWDKMQLSLLKFFSSSSTIRAHAALQEKLVAL